MANKMRAIHPGEILKGELEELNLSCQRPFKSVERPRQPDHRNPE